MLTIEEYERGVASLAIYPHAGEKNLGSMFYPALGFSGETGELVEKLAQLDETASGHNATLISEVLKESGDVLWYMTRVANEIGSDLNSVFTKCLPVLPANNTTEELSFHKNIVELVVAVGAVSELVKKAVRDESGKTEGEISSERRNKIFQKLVDAMESLKKIFAILGTDLLTVAEMNLAKLNERRDRNVINGDGDNR